MPPHEATRRSRELRAQARRRKTARARVPLHATALPVLNREPMPPLAGVLEHGPVTAALQMRPGPKQPFRMQLDPARSPVTAVVRMQPVLKLRRRMQPDRAAGQVIVVAPMRRGLKQPRRMRQAHDRGVPALRERTPAIECGRKAPRERRLASAAPAVRNGREKMELMLQPHTVRRRGRTPPDALAVRPVGKQQLGLKLVVRKLPVLKMHDLKVGAPMERVPKVAAKVRVRGTLPRERRRKAVRRLAALRARGLKVDARALAVELPQPVPRAATRKPHVRNMRSPVLDVLSQRALKANGRAAARAQAKAPADAAKQPPMPRLSLARLRPARVRRTRTAENTEKKGTRIRTRIRTKRINRSPRGRAFPGAPMTAFARRA